MKSYEDIKQERDGIIATNKLIQEEITVLKEQFALKFDKFFNLLGPYMQKYIPDNLAKRGQHLIQSIGKQGNMSGLNGLNFQNYEGKTNQGNSDFSSVLMNIINSMYNSDGSKKSSALTQMNSLGKERSNSPLNVPNVSSLWKIINQGLNVEKPRQLNYGGNGIDQQNSSQNMLEERGNNLLGSLPWKDSSSLYPELSPSNQNPSNLIEGNSLGKRDIDDRDEAFFVPQPNRDAPLKYTMQGKEYSGLSPSVSNQSEDPLKGMTLVTPKSSKNEGIGNALGLDDFIDNNKEVDSFKLDDD